MGNSGLLRMQCQRTTPQQGNCQIEHIYLHPALFFLNRKETLPLSEIRGVNVIEIPGDESDSYRLELEKTTGTQTLFSAMLESTAENRADDLLYFLHTPQEEGVRIRYFDAFSFWFFYLPLYFMLFQFSIALFLKLSGQPFHCHWVILDNQTRQLVTIHNTWLGWSFTKKIALGQVKNIEIQETEGENHDFFRYVAQLKTGKALPLTPNIKIEDTFEFEEMQDDLLEKMRETLHQYQGKSLANG
ncbi:hypothetical protein COW36_21410 [bacterium (Candidatus Blackallbacteria) CG17_big_fil_post_rev_8_21_14_2_50_48_46]|uniref:Uncharacterized protein n=1 Tax=bacterium (Candidatus Blackallbacteria) CG17_big_fil_post_rev_8_21_14_2_50_48_46 TaxID=2014261 RepID=A0A2M7FZ24_9BACT|nr:MAG: hypothetical protein COW64_14710 [bacterium (Candidatus Blackallbacteria) CG18_big_fil_WC_8_21_14_2_50_49_26]PIW14597.1 MAG: hypothetical protein COW36_21410 [bacterium (Candidatus Blackallbacteria) CG17_big_fil_post_rev_8_21_14_2_50_48_46]PIW45648.1 MAG: hypothetical protein COW20_19240 [bacterium (Candidatus Blackallbacteria) CG13_big_fil_rev_8_21_14_2_50_49_14]